jgi:hypothetical protein
LAACHSPATPSAYKRHCTDNQSAG